MTHPAGTLDQEAIRILRGNDRGGYTVPTHGLYPFQWNWDSCIVALGWARIDEPRAFQEIETLFSARWPDGMVPHIVLHRPDPDYFPGPERWGTGRTPPTSGITQPPVAASCLRRLVEGAADRAMAEARGRALLPKLLAWHRWFHTARDPDASGLVTTLHPWETGMDNSPAWDEALGRVEVAADLEPYIRKDTTHVDASMRPTRAEYDRYMTLVQLYRAHGWRHEIARLSPFRVADVGTNCILLRADRDLLALAERFGEHAAADELRGWIARAESAFCAFADPATGLWHSVDQVAGRPSPRRHPRGLPRLLGGAGRRAPRRPARGLAGGRALRRAQRARTGPALRQQALLARPDLARRQLHDRGRRARDGLRCTGRADRAGQPRAGRGRRVQRVFRSARRRGPGRRQLHLDRRPLAHVGTRS